MIGQRASAGYDRAVWDFLSVGSGVVALRQIEEPPAPPDIVDEAERAAWVTGYRMAVADIEMFVSLPADERMQRRFAVLMDGGPSWPLGRDRLGGLMAFGAGRGLDRAGRAEDAE